MKPFRRFPAASALFLLCLPWLASEAAVDAGLRSIPGARILGEYEVSDIVRSVDNKEESSLCTAQARKEESTGRECGIRFLIIELTGSAGPEIALVKKAEKGKGYESFLLQHIPSFLELFDKNFRKNCEYQVESALEIATRLCHARPIGGAASTSTSAASARRYLFQKDLKPSDYESLSVKDLTDCNGASAIGNSIVSFPIPLIGASEPAYLIDGLDSEHPSITRQRETAVLLVPFTVRTRYELRKL